VQKFARISGKTTILCLFHNAPPLSAQGERC